VIRAGASRLSGDLAGAAGILEGVRSSLAGATCDRGLAERERARTLRELGEGSVARDAFATAEGTFRPAGERWLAEATAREAVGA
jgi:hypothetical protein